MKFYVKNKFPKSNVIYRKIKGYFNRSQNNNKPEFK